jgi:ABC-2 type transport system permease protein
MTGSTTTATIQIARREWQIAFAGPTASIFLAAFAAASTVLAFEVGGLFEAGLAELTAWFQFLPWLLCVFAPALTMSAWSGERREGSLEYLLGLPVSPVALALGKFLTCWLLSVLALVVVLPLWLMVGLLGPVDHGATLATLVGAVLVCGAAVSVSLAASTRAGNQSVAFMLGAAACIILTAPGLPGVEAGLAALAGAPLASAARGMTLLGQFEGLQRGVIDAATVIYCIGMMVAGVAITAALITPSPGRAAGSKGPGRLVTRSFLPALVIGIILAFSGIALLARVAMPGVRLDATEARLYTLSPATRAVLDGLDTPVDVTLYIPASNAGLDPAYVSYAGRVQDLLGAYARQSGGRVRLDIQRVTPFSQAEDRALEAGLVPLDSTAGGPPGWFGLTLVNAVDQMVSIPSLDPATEGRLEYDITAGLVRLQQDMPPAIAVLSDLPWLFASTPGEPRGRAVAPVAMALAERYPVAVLAPDFDAIPEETGVLVIAQPFELTPWQSWLVDQFVMRRGRVVMALDPALSTGRDVGGRAVLGEALADLLDGWGLAVSERATADRDGALPVQSIIGGRSAIVPHPFYFAIPQAGLSQSDPVTASLSAGVHFATAGAVSLKPGSTLRLEPLATTSARSRAFPASFVLSGAGPEQVLADWARSDGPTVIGARITGILQSATAALPPPPAPDGATAPPQPVLQQSEAPVMLYLFGDADFLYDGLYQGQSGPIADNEALFLNVIDALAGGAQLADVRSRPVRARRLEVIDRLRNRSQSQLLEEQRALEVRVAELDRQLTGQRGGEITTAGEAGEAGFRRELIAARQRLRTLQTATGRQIGMVRTGMIAVCAGLVPVAWLGLGFGLFWQRQRTARRQLEALA